MRARLGTLRWRVTVATTVLGALLSLLFAAATVFITEDYEALLCAEILGSQAQDYSLALAANANAPLPQSHRLSGYLRHADGTGRVPPDLLGLSPGTHVDEAGIPEGISVGVFDVEQGRLYFVMDLSDIEVLEEHLAYFLLAVVLVGTALAAWLGWLLSGLSLDPVRRLAAAVDALPAAPRATHLAANAGPDELGHLAAAIDQYQARLVEAEAEERRFFADASHELRTPIAIVRGVSELLADDPDARPGQRRWLDRLDRGMAQLTLLLDVLLGLARHRERPLEDVSLQELLAESVATLEIADPAALASAFAAPIAWALPRQEARLVLQAVLQRLVGTDAGGRLGATATADELRIAFAPATPSTLPAQLSNERGDGGAGMTLVHRLAGQLGWRIEYAGEPDGTRIARVTRDASAR